MLGSMSSPTFTDIGGEHIIDATAVRWLPFASGTGNVPAIGTSITQGGVSGYLLGVWASTTLPPTASGSAMPATGFIKFREVTNGPYTSGALSGISASATGPDVPGWIEVVYDSASNFVVPRVGKFKTRGNWFELGTTNGAVGQQFQVPTTSSRRGFNYAPGAWIETAPGSDQYEFWTALNGPANGWSYRHIGQPLGSTDKRTKFLKSLFGQGKLQIGENYNLKATYASVTAQASTTYADIAISSSVTYAVVSNVCTVNTFTTSHLLEEGMQTGISFTSGGLNATNAIYTITKVIDAYTFQFSVVTANTNGNCTVRPGVTVTATAHGLQVGEKVGMDFTTGTGVDGDYVIYALVSANSYNVSYPHTTALTGGNFTGLHTLRLTVPTISAGQIADIAISANYTYTGYIITFVATGHGLLPGMVVPVDFLTGGLTTDANYQVLEVIDADTFTCLSATASGTAGTATIRPGYTITLADHQKTVGESIYLNFSATIVDGDYNIYQVVDANTFRISVPAHPFTAVTTTTLTATLDHLLAVGNEIYLDFTSGAGVDGKYVIRAVGATTIDVNFAHRVAITTSNVYARMTEGYIPPSGCKVRIPNIIMSETGTTLRSLNLPPNATIASRPEFTTTNAGAIDIEYLYGMSAYMGVMGQAYQMRLQNVAVHDSINISEIATALDIDTIGVGMYSAQDLRAVVFTSCFAGGTVKNVWAHRGNLPGTTDHCFEVLTCAGQTFENIETGIIQFARSTGTVNVATSQNLIFKKLRTINANVLVPSCSNVVFENTEFSDRYIGKTNTTSQYAFVLTGLSNTIKIDGFSLFVTDNHPFAGILSINTCANITMRNVGAFATPLSGGDGWWASARNMNTPVVSAGNNNNIKIQRCFFKNLKINLVTVLNSDKNVLLQSFGSVTPYYMGSGTGTPKGVLNNIPPALNVITKAVYTGIYPTTAQISVYGSHWLDMFRGYNDGSLIITMNEPTSESIGQFTINSGTVLFNSGGGVEMRAVGASATWEMPNFAKGHTGFTNIAPIMSGGTIGNYTLEYQIDTGSGYSTWKTLNGTNLSAEVVDALIGFRLKVKITTAIANTTAITFLRIQTISSELAQSQITYPLDTNTWTLTGLKEGSEVRAYLGTDPATSVEVAGIENSGTSFAFTHSVTGDGYIQIIAMGWNPLQLPVTFTAVDKEIPIQQVIDRNYAT